MQHIEADFGCDVIVLVYRLQHLLPAGPFRILQHPLTMLYTCALLVLLAAATNAAITSVPVNTTRLAGRFFQVFGDALQSGLTSLPSGEGACTTVDFGAVYGSDNMFLQSSTRRDAVPTKVEEDNNNKNSVSGGLIDRMNGFADETQVADGDLSIQYTNRDGVDKFLVIGLGPASSAAHEDCSPNCYDYLLVSDELGASLLVLARDVAVFATEHEATVLEALDQAGFNRPWNRPVAVHHGDDCEYTMCLTCDN